MVARGDPSGLGRVLLKSLLSDALEGTDDLTESAGALKLLKLHGLLALGGILYGSLNSLVVEINDCFSVGGVKTLLVAGLRAALRAALRGSLDRLAGSVGGNFGSVGAYVCAVCLGSVCGNGFVVIVGNCVAAYAGGCGVLAVILGFASRKSKDHGENHNDCENSLHLFVLLLTFYWFFVNRTFHSMFSVP